MIELEREPSPSFQELEYRHGRANAVREWKSYHHADEAIEVAPWSVDEFLAIHNEVAAKSGDLRSPRPRNRAWLVCETGGRLHTPDAFCPHRGGWPAPLDPPEDPLLRLTWQVKYFEALAMAKSAEFAELKDKALKQAQVGSIEDAAERLEILREEIRHIRVKIAELNEEREPLLPAALRQPTEQDSQSLDAADAARAKRVAAIESIEI